VRFRHLFVPPVGTPPNLLELVEHLIFRLPMRGLASTFDPSGVDTPTAVNGVESSVISARSGAAPVSAQPNLVCRDALQALAAALWGRPPGWWAR